MVWYEQLTRPGVILPDDSVLFLKTSFGRCLILPDIVGSKEFEQTRPSSIYCPSKVCNQEPLCYHPGGLAERPCSGSTFRNSIFDMHA